MQIFLEFIKSVILGIVQGVTEWLPISSTGHLILLEQFLTFQLSDSFFETFKVVIQFGSILAVVVLYFHRLNPFSPKKTTLQKKDTWQMWLKVLIASLPAGVIGLLFDQEIDNFLSAPYVIAAALIVYGILFLWLESRNAKPRVNSISQLSYKTALLIGVFQMLALIPGTSRSGATIVGAVILGCSRAVSAEFSFFMAIPVVLGASGYKLLKTAGSFTSLEWLVLLTGTLVAFVMSVFVIRFFMAYIKKHDFKAFGYYRIVLGLAVLVWFLITA